MNDADLEVLAPSATDDEPTRGHAAESYYVMGEGLLTEQAGGRELATVALAGGNGRAHQIATGITADPPFRFSRLGPKGRQPVKATRRVVARAMTADNGTVSQIPAGYTYLGQFIDHDLTFDKTKVRFGADVSQAELLQARSPALDLDSLYGAGPADPGSERFYASDGRKLKMGRTEGVGSGPRAAQQGFDLPRHPQLKRPVIPDHRNDENLAVAQTHLAFIRFHNRVVDELSSTPAAQRFDRARRLVVKHYQWMIRHDYLPRICDPAVVDDVFANGRKLVDPAAAPTSVPTMPLEFSVAAFRFGHSMVRADYNWNIDFDDGQGTLGRLFAFSSTGGSLGMGANLPSNWIADWRRLYRFKQADLKVPARKFNTAMRIDTLLVDVLRTLPVGTFGGKEPLSDRLEANLAFRNLTRARMVRLSTGQDMVNLLKGRGVTVAPLTKGQIRDGDGGADLTGLEGDARAAFFEHTPLWFYVLREAELNQGKLAGVGARIVAETFHRAIEGSASSIIRDGAFRPRFGPDDTTFKMADLLHFAFEGRKALLAPLGD